MNALSSLSFKGTLTNLKNKEVKGTNKEEDIQYIQKIIEKFKSSPDSFEVIKEFNAADDDTYMVKSVKDKNLNLIIQNRNGFSVQTNISGEQPISYKIGREKSNTDVSKKISELLQVLSKIPIMDMKTKVLSLWD